MRKLLIVLIISFPLSFLHGQQDEQFTQFMNFRQGLNPAYAGSDGIASILALVRNQWLGFEGAPQSQIISFNAPVFGNKVGVGGSLLRNTIGVTERFTAEGDYNYAIRVGQGILRVGLRTSVRMIRMDFSKVIGTQSVTIDEAIPVGIQSKYLPNFGAGIYYSGENFYFGISIPRLLKNNLSLADADLIVSREIQHGYMMGGLNVKLGGEASVRTHILLKYVEGSPFDGDFNVSLDFSNKFVVGASYRLGGSINSGIGESVSGLVGVGIGEKLQLGFSYDYTLSDLRDYNSGSIEGMIKYFIGGNNSSNPNKEIPNPRVFF